MRGGAPVRPSGIERPPLSHKNHLDLLRLVFAFMVLRVHAARELRQRKPAR
jgi:hypothetical protein